MKKEADDIFSRIRVICAFFLFLLLIIVGRMFQKQIIEYKTYKVEAKSQQQFSKVELGQRGKIYFHDGPSGIDKEFSMAYDVKSFSVYLVPKNISDKKDFSSKLSALINLPADEIFAKIDNDKTYTSAIKKGLSYEDADKIEAAELTGVYVLPEYKRYYPESSVASQILGFVDGEGNGKYGFEGFYNDELTGSSGKIVGEKDTLGRVINYLEEDTPKDGNSYLLTVDRSVQYYMTKTLQKALTDYQAESGSVVAMDIKSGAIIGMTSLPNYDSNNYQEYANNNQQDLYKNPVISNIYEPGSIFKPLIVAAGLDTGKITPDSGSTFGASVDVQGYTIHTAEDKAFGAEKIGDILKHSDNVGMVWVGEQIGSEIMNNYIKKFGFTEKTNIDLSGENIGIIPSLKNWAEITRATITFGQGISVTPIQLLRAYAAIANKGTMVKPRIVDKVYNNDGTTSEVKTEEVGQVVSEKTSEELKQMMIGVVEEGYGKKAGVKGYWVAGKTGTAQIADPETGKYVEGVFIHSFAGFAPADDPKFALLVKIDKPKNARFAESSAAPVFGDIASFLLNYYYRVAPNR